MHINLDTIILSHRDHGERDRLYTLLTRERGKLTVRGSGARKSGAKLAPHLEPLMHSHVVVAKNRGRGTITFALCEESFYHVRAQNNAYIHARGVIDVIERLLRDGDIHRNLYTTLLMYMRTLDILVERKEQASAFCAVTEGCYFYILAMLGWYVQTYTCTRCAKRLSQSTSYTYLCADGGFICKNCLRETAIPREQKIILSRDAAAALRVFDTQYRRSAHIAHFAKVRMSQEICDELRNFTIRRMKWIM